MFTSCFTFKSFCSFGLPYLYSHRRRKCGNESLLIFARASHAFFSLPKARFIEPRAKFFISSSFAFGLRPCPLDIPLTAPLFLRPSEYLTCPSFTIVGWFVFGSGFFGVGFGLAFASASLRFFSANHF